MALLSALENKEEEEQEGKKERGGCCLIFCLSSNHSAKPQHPASFDSCVAQREVLNTGMCVVNRSVEERGRAGSSSPLLSLTTDLVPSAFRAQPHTAVSWSI